MKGTWVGGRGHRGQEPQEGGGIRRRHKRHTGEASAAWLDCILLRQFHLGLWPLSRVTLKSGPFSLSQTLKDTAPLFHQSVCLTHPADQRAKPCVERLLGLVVSASARKKLDLETSWKMFGLIALVGSHYFICA